MRCRWFGATLWRSGACPRESVRGRTAPRRSSHAGSTPAHPLRLGPLPHRSARWLLLRRQDPLRPRLGERALRVLRPPKAVRQDAVADDAGTPTTTAPCGRFRGGIRGNRHRRRPHRQPQPLRGAVFRFLRAQAGIADAGGRNSRATAPSRWGVRCVATRICSTRRRGAHELSAIDQPEAGGAVRVRQRPSDSVVRADRRVRQLRQYDPGPNGGPMRTTPLLTGAGSTGTSSGP